MIRMECDIPLINARMASCNTPGASPNGFWLKSTNSSRSMAAAVCSGSGMLPSQALTSRPNHKSLRCSPRKRFPMTKVGVQQLIESPSVKGKSVDAYSPKMCLTKWWNTIWKTNCSIEPVPRTTRSFGAFSSAQLGVAASWTKYLVVKLLISGRSKVKGYNLLSKCEEPPGKDHEGPPCHMFFHLTLVHGVTYTLIVFDPWSWQNGEGWSTNHDWLNIYIYKHRCFIPFDPSNCNTCLCQRGENRASVLAVFENTHILSRHMHIHVTSLGSGGGDVNVHVNLRHMHIWRYASGLGGWGC